MDAEAPDRRLIGPSGEALRLAPGRPLPFGVTETRDGLNFAVFSRHADEMTLVLFAPTEHDHALEIPLDRALNKTGDVWHVEVEGLDLGMRYGWRADGPRAAGDPRHRFDPSLVLIDPHAPALSGGASWGEHRRRRGEPSDTKRPARRALAVRDEFDWQSIRPPRLPLQDKVIYELHLRGFTRHASSGVKHPGTYLGLVEKIPYLKDLGVTTVELLPIVEFDELEVERVNPLTAERLKNYWGYSPICFFAPKASYAADGRAGNQVRELKTLIREMHRAGIEVFLDVVFNHTAEGAGDEAPTYSLRGLDNAVYYLLDPVTGAYLNFSGCGNTVNCNDPVVRGLIIDALRHWVAEMHVDGFRFDLASILGRGRSGEVLANPPLLERIAGDPVLAGATLIAEAWDAAGLYQVGSFPAWGRWAELNGPFRDDVRRFVRGDRGFAAVFATRLSGSADLFERSGRAPCHSINFITCHDGFTLADLVSYDRKHNEANGEDNRDGWDENFSWNCGVEGPSSDPAVLELRRRQARNFLTILMLAQGTPMLLAGDEFGRTQRGNNNPYCQDNDISWVDWTLAESNRDLLRFTKLLIAFRRAHPVLRRPDFLLGRGTAEHPRPDVAWHGVRLGAPDWGPDSQVLAMHLAGEHASSGARAAGLMRDADIYFAANASAGDLRFELPDPPAGSRWRQVIDTAAPSPRDIVAPGEEAPLRQQRSIVVRARSCVVLIGR